MNVPCLCQSQDKETRLDIFGVVHLLRIDTMPDRTAMHDLGNPFRSSLLRSSREAPSGKTNKAPELNEDLR